MPAVGYEACLKDAQGRTGRAWQLGRASPGPAVLVHTWHLPVLSMHPELNVETSRGWLPAGSLTEEHWLRVTKPEMQEGVDQIPYGMSGTASAVYAPYESLLVTQPIDVIDMMQCPEHVAAWRRDCLILRPRKIEPWYSGMVSEGRDSWWMRVIEIYQGFADIVPLQGRWHVLGVPIAA